MTLTGDRLQSILSLVNTGGVVAILVVAISLGLRGDIVTAEQLTDCRTARDAYLREWVRAIDARAATVTPRKEP